MADESKSDTEMLRKEIEDIKSELIEQDHRGFTILKRFFIERRQWAKDDPKRDAAAKALLYRLFFSPGSAAIGGTILAVATLAGVALQVQLLNQGNKELKFQNALIHRQFQTARQTELVRILYETQTADDGTFEPAAHWKLRSKAAVEFIQIERERLGYSDNDGELPPSVDLSHAELRDVNLKDQDLRNVSLQNADLRGANFVAADLRGARLSNAKVWGTTFQNSDMRRAGGLLIVTTNWLDDRQPGATPKVDFSYTDIRGGWISLNLSAEVPNPTDPEGWDHSRVASEVNAMKHEIKYGLFSLTCVDLREQSRLTASVNTGMWINAVYEACPDENAQSLGGETVICDNASDATAVIASCEETNPAKIDFTKLRYDDLTMQPSSEESAQLSD